MQKNRILMLSSVKKALGSSIFFLIIIGQIIMNFIIDLFLPTFISFIGYAIWE